jgi:hypothetical protein
MKWTIGITTAPRDQGYYLDQTLKSLSGAGFDNPVVFAEPGSIIPPDFNGHVVKRRKKYGDWTNWATGLYELFLSEPSTDFFLMLEDDALLSTGLRNYLEYSLPYLGEFASLNLYTSSKYFCSKKIRMFHNECQGKRTWSTVAVVMSHNAVLSFFSDKDVQKHRFFDIFKVKEGFWNVNASYGMGRSSEVDCVGNTVKDAVIGQWAERLALPVFYHTPSLVEHIGEFSTLTDDVSSVENGRMSFDFVGKNFDVSCWVGEEVKVRRKVISQLF